MRNRAANMPSRPQRGWVQGFAERVLELRFLNIWKVWGGTLEIFFFSIQSLAVKPFLPNNQKENLKYHFMLPLSTLLLLFSTWSLHHAGSFKIA